VPLVTVGIAVLRAKVGDLGVGERKRVTLVVVVRLVLGQRVVGIEHVVVREALAHREGQSDVLAACRRLDGCQRAYAVEVRRRRKAVGPHRAKQWVVAVGEARQVLRLVVADLGAQRQVIDDLALVANVERIGVGILKIFVKHENSGLERIANLVLWNQLRVRRRRRQDTGRAKGAVAIQRLPATAVGGTARRQVQPRDAGVVDTRRHPNNRPAISPVIPRIYLVL